MKPLLDFDDAGAEDDHPARGVTVGDIRAWFDAITELLSGHDNLYLAQFGEHSNPRDDIAAKAARAAVSTGKRGES